MVSLSLLCVTSVRGKDHSVEYMFTSTYKFSTSHFHDVVSSVVVSTYIMSDKLLYISVHLWSLARCKALYGTQITLKTGHDQQ